MDGPSARLETQDTLADGVREGRLPLSAVERADFGVAPSLAVRIWLIVGPFHIAADAPRLSGAFVDSRQQVPLIAGNANPFGSGE